MSKRIGILTGGGDCPGLNAVIRSVVKHATGTYGYEVIGIEDAFVGLVENRIVELPPSRVRGLLDRGGTILGSSNRGNPFAFPVRHGDQESLEDRSDQALANLEKLGLEGLIVVGGDGTMGIAKRMQDKGANMVGVPKTIDNDLLCTEYTVGFQTAVDVATAAIDRLHSTAESHDRIIICEVMGRYAGWIALHSGIASGAEVVLIPEIEYDIDRVVQSIQARHRRGISFSIVVVAEGAVPAGGEHAVVEAGDASKQERLGGAGDRLSQALAERTRFDTRVTVLGHIQRGGTPCAFDRLLATRFGARAVDLLAAGEFGRCTALNRGQVEAVDLALAASKLKRVDPQGDVVHAARSVGIEMGQGPSQV